jgi:hypothetical protein
MGSRYCAHVCEAIAQATQFRLQTRQAQIRNQNHLLTIGEIGARFGRTPLGSLPCVLELDANANFPGMADCRRPNGE